MVTVVSSYKPIILFIAEEGSNPYYFKEDVILPDEYPPAPENKDTPEGHYDTIVFMGRNGLALPPGSRFSDRILATVRLAELLGIEDIIAPAWRGTCEYEGVSYSGTMSPPIRGVSYFDLNKYKPLSGLKLCYTPSAVKQLTILMIFDYICGQIDRHYDNIKLITDIDYDDITPAADDDSCYHVNGIYAIDHDLSFGEIGYTEIKKQVVKGHCISPVVLDEMHYTAVDMDFCDRIFAISEEDFYERFSDLLSDGEIEAYFDRVDGLRLAIELQTAVEDDLRSRGEEFFSRLITSDDMYAGYLRRTEEAVLTGDRRFSYRPTYLRKDLLLHSPLGGGKIEV